MGEKGNAVFVKDIKDWQSVAKLFKINPSMEYEKNGETKKTNYVIVSAVVAFDTGRPETFIFPANKKGDCLDFGELNGSFRGGLNHEKALKNAGYVIQKGELC